MKMTKTIAKMKEQGMYERIHSFVKDKIQEGDNPQEHKKELESIIKFEFVLEHSGVMDVMLDEMSDIALQLIAESIIEDAQEELKMDALNAVDTDALFEKATGHKPDDSGLKKSNEEKLEDAIVDGFLNFLNDVLGK